MELTRRTLIASAAALGVVNAIRPRSAKAADKVLISQASKGFLYVPSYVAAAAGYFADEGVDVEFTSVKVTGGPATALAAGQVQFAYAAASNVILAQAQGVDIVAVGAMVGRVQADLVIQPEIAARLGLTEATPMPERIRALKGLSFAVNGFGGGLDQVVRYLVRSEAMDPERDMVLTAIPEASGILAAFEHKRIDGFIFSPPTSSVAVAKDGGYLLINMSRGDFEPLRDFLYGALLAKSSWAAENKDLTVRVMRAYTRALDMVAKDPEGTKQAIKPYFEGLDDDIFTRAFEAVKSSYPATPRVTEAHYRQNMDFLRAVKGSVPDLQLSALYDNSYCDAAAK